jgi:hypothetical protein
MPDALVDAALARGILPIVGDLELPLPMQVPVDHARGIKIIHGDAEPGNVGHPQRPAAS